MLRRPPKSTRTDTLFPATTVFRSRDLHRHDARGGGALEDGGVRLDSIGWVRGARVHFRPVAHELPPQRIEQTLFAGYPHAVADRSEEHTSELQSLMRISYAVFSSKTISSLAAPRPAQCRAHI